MKRLKTRGIHGYVAEVHLVSLINKWRAFIIFAAKCGFVTIPICPCSRIQVCQMFRTGLVHGQQFSTIDISKCSMHWQMRLALNVPHSYVMLVGN